MSAVENAQQIDPDQVVAANLRAELSRQRWTGRKAAVALGITQTYVNRRTKGETPMSPADLVMFADLIGIPVARLFEGTKKGPTSEEAGPDVHPLGLEPRTHWFSDGIAHGWFGESAYLPSAHVQPHPLDARRQVRPIVKLHATQGEVA